MFSFIIREENILILRRYRLKYVGVKCCSDSNLYSKKFLRNTIRVFVYICVCACAYIWGAGEKREKRFNNVLVCESWRMYTGILCTILKFFYVVLKFLKRNAREKRSLFVFVFVFLTTCIIQMWAANTGDNQLVASNVQGDSASFLANPS